MLKYGLDLDFIKNQTKRSSMYVKKRSEVGLHNPLVRHNSTSNGGNVGSRIIDKPDHMVGKMLDPIEEEKNSPSYNEFNLGMN